MRSQIITPYGVRVILQQEFRIQRPTLDKVLLGAPIKDVERKRIIRERAIELGGIKKV